ncbi:DNA cytosine methyltransferase [Danxiaibacter flavus]|uniref:DNA (cytosine-5-)-methyltransferase n=1 Tax=Danxiaibacter flavus TaxID=3049108 RepID=A0ABV3ZM89_9BACT|nr:DNA cytosine methyltransferase [Chitinophagaceae bacterium DXS]
MKKLSQQDKPKLKAVDFFCCSGGVTCGFRKAGITVLGGIDIDDSYKETYEKNNKGAAFIQADIASYQPEQLAADLNIVPNMDDMVFVGCSPCQYYTTMQTDKTKSSGGKLLLEEFKRFVDYFRPGFLFVENVPGLETKAGSPLARFKNYIESLGYVFDDDIVNASDYKVPQNRKRYVLVATRLGKQIKIPIPKNRTQVTVRHAIGHLPEIEAGHKDDGIDKHWTGRLETINLKRIRKTPHDGGTRLAWKDDDDLQLKCYKGKDKTFIDVYSRIFWDLPSPTITTKFYSISNGRFGHPEQDRGLSIKEGAILQSFPANYHFYSNSMVVAARMIGNAVPPKLAQAIAECLLQCYKHYGSIQNQGQSS